MVASLSYSIMIWRPLLLLALGAPPLAAQQHPSLRAALDSARAQNEWTLGQQTSICEIPAPPFKEGQRAAEMQRRFAALGLTSIRLDGIGNVVAELRGRTRKPVVVLSAHLDTVFPEGTDVKVRREGSVFSGPGIADDCRGLAVLLVVAKALREAVVPLEGTVVFLATVGEEGLGNGRGARHFFEKEMPGQVDYFLTVDAADFQIVNRAAGSRRYEVTFRGPGGHSYDNFVMPHPTHALGRAIAKIGAFEVPADPKTTFNVGIVKGGVAVNVVAPTASMVIDLRSESAEELNRLEAKLRQAVHEALLEERARWPTSTAALEVSWDTLGIRPGGRVAESSPIVTAVLASGRAIGVTPVFTSASTDANIPMSLGVPALAIGIGGHPTGEHSLAEKYDDGPAGYRGPQWVILITAALAGVR
jgi:tripeptide aminopeptidase